MLNLTRDNVSFAAKHFQVELLEDTMKEHTGKIFSNARSKPVHMLAGHNKLWIHMSGSSIKRKFVNSVGRSFKIFNASTCTGMLNVALLILLVMFFHLIL